MMEGEALGERGRVEEGRVERRRARLVGEGLMSLFTQP